MHHECLELPQHFTALAGCTQAASNGTYRATFLAGLRISAQRATAGDADCLGLQVVVLLLPQGTVGYASMVHDMECCMGHDIKCCIWKVPAAAHAMPIGAAPPDDEHCLLIVECD